MLIHIMRGVSLRIGGNRMRRLLSVSIIITIIVLFLGSCSEQPLPEKGDNSTEKLCVIEQTPYYKVERRGSLYYCDLLKINGSVAKSEGPFSKEPTVDMVDDRLVQFTTQGGTGISTRASYFYDVQNDLFSDIYMGVWDCYDTLVLYSRHDTIIVQDIYQKNIYYFEISLADRALAKVADSAFVDIKFVANGGAIAVTYLTEDYSEKTEIIYLN